MTRIHQLDSELVSKIAAGEVVDRPASVVKELIENALDAGASDISIDIQESGIKRIKITDNGFGMDKDDILLSFKPHTTSKIINEEDLLNIQQFGFRGEALSSIASVSRLTIKSRPHVAQNGLHIEVSGNTLLHHRPTGMPAGTEIIVESLFENVPARKKFLKDLRTELRAITSIVVNTALAFPAIGFKYSHDGKILLNVPSHQDRQTRIQTILGDTIFKNTIPVSLESEYGNVQGFIGTPQIAERSRTHQYIFVNNRTIKDTKILKVIEKSYGNLLEVRSFPFFILFLTVPYESVDVNIHPRKEEVAFAYSSKIYELVGEAVHQALHTYSLSYIKDSSVRKYKIPEQQFILRDSGMDVELANTLKTEVRERHLHILPNQAISQIHSLYLLTQVEQGFMIIDQHAAHERVLYEQFLQAFQNKKQIQESYVLPKPFIFELSTTDALDVEHELTMFGNLGFEIETFGKNTFKLTTLPSIFKSRIHTELIKEMLHEILEKNTSNSTDANSEKTIAYLACRSAVKAGDVLNTEQRQQLLEQLFKCNQPYTCPHGRPTHIILSLTELHRMFKRI